MSTTGSDEADLSAGTWFPYRKAEGARLRLVCWPWAGSGANVFRDWPEWLPEGIDLCAAQLPGHETRFDEPPIKEAESLTAGVLEALANLPPLPTVLLGYSLGALLAFDAARTMQASGYPPSLLVVAAAPAPTLARGSEGLALVERLRQLGSERIEEVLLDPDLADLFLPVIVADLALADGYRRSPGPPLLCPIFAVGSDADPSCSEADLLAWRSETSAGFSHKLLSGGHFFDTDPGFRQEVNLVLAGLVPKALGR